MTSTNRDLIKVAGRPALRLMPLRKSVVRLTERRRMESNNVTIVFDNAYTQPELLYNVKFIEIRRDNIKIIAQGYTKIFFKDKVKNITADSGVKIIIR